MDDTNSVERTAGSGTYTAEMQAEMDRLSQVVTQFVDFDREPDAEARRIDESVHAVWNIDLPEVASVRHLRIPAHASIDAAPCDAVIYEPTDAGEGVIFFVHGGGWALCNLATHERFMRVLCNETRRTLIGVHYRLAPENPFPAALHDVVSAFRTVMEDPAKLGLPTGPVVIAGDSAGGNLALTTLLHEIAAGRDLPVGGLLYYGVFGHDFETQSYREHAEDHVLTTEIMRTFWRWYAPDEATHRDPLAVPLLASDEALRALPPLLLVAAELDPLTSDTLELKRRLDAVGRNDRLHVENGVIHGFLQMTAMLEAARRATCASAEAAVGFMSDASRVPA